MITVALIEKFPEAYDGAMPLCGAVSPTLTMFKRRLFDLLVVFDYYYPGAIGSPVKFADNVAAGRRVRQGTRQDHRTPTR